MKQMADIKKYVYIGRISYHVRVLGILLENVGP